MVSYIAIFLFGFGVATLLWFVGQPYRKMNEEELLCAVDLINQECAGDYARSRLMMDELFMWVTDTKPTGAVGKRLAEIIEMSTMGNQ